MAYCSREALEFKRKSNIEELLVFGYSCKLFRDDERAKYIDQGKHLIPHMSDDTLKIDRYDGRANLSDLRYVEAPSGGFDRFHGLTKNEKKVELLCDEERYRAMTTNEDEEIMYIEEELKRVENALGERGKTYGEVGYSYKNQEEVIKPEPRVVEEDKPFVPSPVLDIPLNMILPPTMKQNAVIEKTAAFICSQGPQMEILLKMKQAGNPMFDFLSYENPLHGYYRLVSQSIKNGRYRPQSEKPEEEDSEENVEDDDNDHYLHPSLVPSFKSAPSIPTINYKPSENCAYSMLVNKIKDKAISRVQGEANMDLDDSSSHSSLCNSENATPHYVQPQLSPCESSSQGNEKEENVAQPRPDPEPDPAFESASPANAQQSHLSIMIPPPSDQVIIDKMASYVAKNGKDFENIVKNKNDSRFDFLNAHHCHNAYYLSKLQLYTQMEKAKNQITEEQNSDSSDGSTVPIQSKSHYPENSDIKDGKEKVKIKVAPVSFSIKPKDVEAPIIEKSALPVEDSTDDEEGKDKAATPPELEEPKVPHSVSPEHVPKEKVLKNKKLLEEQLKKDRLTAAARERVVSLAKEKHMQLERKRKAIAFLRQMQNNPDNKVEDSKPVLNGNTCDREPNPNETDPNDFDVAPLIDPNIIEVDSSDSEDDSVSSLSDSSSSSSKRHRSKSKKKVKKSKKRKHKSKHHKKHSKRHKKHHR